MIRDAADGKRADGAAAARAGAKRCGAIAVHNIGGSIEQQLAQVLFRQCLRLIARQRNVRFGRPPKLTPGLIRQVLLAHDDASTTVPETCRVLGISKSSYYAALREGRRQALETAEAA